MSENTSVLKVENLHVTYGNKKRQTFAVQDVSLSLVQGETLGVVGESGCGKTTVAMALMGLLDSSTKVTGTMFIKGVKYDLEEMNYKDWRQLRGNKIAMVFQDSLAALNPLKRIGEQIAEAIFVKDKSLKSESKKRAIELLEMVEIPDAKQRARQYPHECSGGMRQRAMIAMALANEPDILICDEPTTALDVTVQAQILDLIKKLQLKMGMAVILVTHDLGVISAVTDRVNVMYASKIVEMGTTRDLMASPSHPYTNALLCAMPNIDAEKGELHAIPGVPPTLNTEFEWCPYGPRCSAHSEECDLEMPALLPVSSRNSTTWCACVHPLSLSETAES